MKACHHLDTGDRHATGSDKKTAKVTFATQADPVVLQTLKSIAASEGRQMQAPVDEALRDYIERKTGNAPRGHVMEAFRNSMEHYDSLYRELAK